MALNDFENFISPLIEQQFPSVYRDDGPEFVAFAKAYYEYLEQDSTSDTPADKGLYTARRMMEYSDVDQSVDTFLDHFRKQYLQAFPMSINQGTPFTIKHIMDLYRSKGTPRAVELFIRIWKAIETEK